MKKFSNSIRSHLLVIATTLTMIFGCQKEIFDFKESEKNNLSIQEAREHFVSKDFTDSSKQARLSANDSVASGPKALWEKAYNRNSTYGEAVIVPLEFKQRKIFVSGGDRAFEYGQLNYLFMYKNDKRQVQTEQVTLMPSDEWVNGDQKVFTGEILVDSWDKKDRRIYSFSKQGETSAQNIVGPSKDKGNKGVKNGRTNFVIYQVCITTTQPCGTAQVSTSTNNQTGFVGSQCSTTHCGNFPVWDEDPWGGAAGTAGTGGFGSELGLIHNFNGSSGGTGGGGGNYLPTCNPNIPSGTPVGPNELPPCQTLTPVGPYTTPGGIVLSFTAPSPEPYLFFDEGDPLALWFEAHTLFSSLQPLPLPTYNSFYAAYPKNPNNTAADMPAADVYNLIGGRVKALRDEEPATYHNACALRISRALNYCAGGHQIPQSNWTVKGADGKNYFLSQAHLYAYMMIRYQASPKTVLTTEDGDDWGMLFLGKLQPKKGIYFMEPINKGIDGFRASGHATLFTGINCIGDCYFAPPNPRDEQHGVKKITLFELF